MIQPADGARAAAIDPCSPSQLGLREQALIGAHAVVMVGVCMLACVVPAKRALAIEPKDALGVDGRSSKAISPGRIRGAARVAAHPRR